MPAAAFDDDDDTSLCTEHRTSPGGGICAICLQEKLGKLVSSSSSSFLIHSSSSSPSFRSDLPSSTTTTATATTSSSLALSLSNLRNHQATTSAPTRYQSQHNGGPRLPFLLTPKKKKKSSPVGASPSSHTLAVLNRSKSTTAPTSRFQDFSTSTPRRHKGFWSFLHLPSSHPKKTVAGPTPTQASTSTAAAILVDETDDSPNSSDWTSSFGRKVSRSRSVGCGSRSFSGDFFERISTATGFGDCTLRRVESQREGAQKHRHSTSAAMREKVRCGGLFGGFMMITSSSSSSTTSSSGYWAGGEANGHRPGGGLVHGRSRSWGWAFASPRRAFGGKPTTNSMIKDGKTEISNANGNSSNNNKTPNLAAIPSLLSVRG